MKNNKFCTLELAQQLKEKGFNLPCEYVYANHYRGKDKILEQCPGLSDDGYMPTLDDARTWLRDNHSFHLVISPEADYFRSLLILPNQFGFVGVGGATVQIYNPELEPSHHKSTVFKSYEKALEAGLKEALKYVDKWNKV